jgi:hypothetical protein
MYIEYVQGVIKSSNQNKTTIHDKKKTEKKVQFGVTSSEL